MKFNNFRFLALFILSACAPAPQATIPPEVTVTATPHPVFTSTPIPTPTVHPQFLSLQDQIAASGETFTLNQNGQIEMRTEEGMTIVPDIQVHPDGTMTFTYNGEEHQVDAETLVVEGQTITFKDQDGKTWVFDGTSLNEEIREFVPAETIEFSETLSKYDLVLAPDADLKAIYWDIAVAQLGNAISKSEGMEANRKVYEEIIKDHPEWEGISHSADYQTRLDFMKEFLTRTGGMMTVTDMNWNKYEADFNQPVKFEVIEVDALSPTTANFLALSGDNLYGRGGGGNMFVDNNGQITYKVEIVASALDSALSDKRSLYMIWSWLAGEITSDLFRQTIAQLAYKDRDSDKHNYKLYTRGGVPKSGSFYKNVNWTFIKSKGSLGLSGVRGTLDQDTQAEMVEVGVPKRTSLNQFDFIVDTFSERIGPAFHKIVQDEFEPVFQGHQKGLESGHSLFFNLFDPTQQCGSGFFTVSDCLKDRAELFFQLMADLQFG